MSTHATGRRLKAWRKGELWLLATPLVLLLGIAAWNFGKPRLIKRMIVPRLTLTARNSISSVAYSPDGNIVAGGEGFGDYKKAWTPVGINLWNARTGQLINRMGGHTGSVETLVFSPDGQWLASGSFNEPARLWNVQTGQLVWSLPKLSIESSVVFTSDSKNLIVLSGTVIEVRDVATRKLRRSFKFNKPISFYCAVALSPDDCIFAVSYVTEQHLSAMAITLWSVPSGRELKTIDVGSAKAIAFSRDSKLLLSCGTDSIGAPEKNGHLNAFDVASGRSRWSHSGGPSLFSIAVHPKTNLVVTGGVSNIGSRFYDANDGRFITLKNPLRLLPHNDEMFTSTSSFAFSPDGGALASRCNNTIELWDITSVLHDFAT